MLGRVVVVIFVAIGSGHELLYLKNKTNIIMPIDNTMKSQSVNGVLRFGKYPFSSYIYTCCIYN